MQTHHRKLRLAGLLMLIALLSACALPAPIARIFATETPTSTATPTKTATPTATPPSPLTIAPCPTSDRCTGAIPIYDLISVNIESGKTYTVEVPYDRSISFFAGWFAQDQGIVMQNSGKMQRFMEIDGQDYWQYGYVGSAFPYTIESEPGKVYSAIWQGVSLSGWKVGETHTVRIGFTTTEQITDGWSVYPKGYTVAYTYRIEPVFIPTATPTPEPTATKTPRPTNTRTPQPTAVPYTKTPSCDQSANITINNTTGGQLTLYLNGPAKYTFYLGGGYTTLNVCGGSYSYTAYGCGGASDTGSINSGEEHEFYCY